LSCFVSEICPKLGVGIINNKSELGIRVEKLLPELSSPFEISGARVNKTGPQNEQQFKS